MFRIKVCGITNLEDAQAAIEYGADAIGFVFARQSKRRISPQEAEKIINKLPDAVLKVGVFANQKIDEIRSILERCKIDILQFHGDETPEFCNSLAGFKTIKAFRVKDKDGLKHALDYDVDAYLLDTFAPDSLGGTGKIFDWTIAREFVKTSPKPVILSGGLKSDNIIEAINIVGPQAVDVSSGVENKSGRKDHRLLKEFIEKAKRCLNKKEGTAKCLC